MTGEVTTKSRQFNLRALGGMLVLLAMVAAILLLQVVCRPNRYGPKSPRGICLSQLKQIGLAIAMYADADPQHRCPTDGNPPTLLGSLQLLSNVVVNSDDLKIKRSSKILYCPNDLRGGPEPDFGKLTTNNISYSYVPNLIWNDHPDSIVALDRIYTTEKGSKWPLTGNHKDDGGIVLFGDGHVRGVPVLPSTLKDKDGKQVVLSP